MRLGSSESEHPRLSNREIIFQEFQPTVYVITIHQRYSQTDRWTDRRLCRSNIALRTYCFAR